MTLICKNLKIQQQKKNIENILLKTKNLNKILTSIRKFEVKCISCRAENTKNDCRSHIATCHLTCQQQLLP